MPTQVAQRAPMRCSRSSPRRRAGGPGASRGGASSTGGGPGGAGAGAASTTGVTCRRGRALARRAGTRPALELPHAIDEPAHALLERGHALVVVGGPPRARRAQGDESHDDRDHGQDETDGDSRGKHDLARAYTTAFPGPVGFVPSRAATDRRY